MKDQAQVEVVFLMVVTPPAPAPTPQRASIDASHGRLLAGLVGDEGPMRTALGRAPSRRTCACRRASAPGRLLLLRGGGAGRPPSCVARGSSFRSVCGARGSLLAWAATAPTTRLPRLPTAWLDTAASPAAAAQPPPSRARLRPDPGHARRCGPSRAPPQQKPSAMSFGGSQPRQPHGREVSAAFRQRFAGRVNRTGRDGQLENYSRVRPGARARSSWERRGAVIPPGQLAPAQSAHAAFARRASRTGPTRGSWRRRGRRQAALLSAAATRSPQLRPPRDGDVDVEVTTTTPRPSTTPEDVEPSSAAPRTVSPVKRRSATRRRLKNGAMRNEDLVRKPRDQLYYSRKARAVSNFKPYTYMSTARPSPRNTSSSSRCGRIERGPRFARKARQGRKARPTRRNWIGRINWPPNNPSTGRPPPPKQPTRRTRPGSTPDDPGAAAEGGAAGRRRGGRPRGPAPVFASEEAGSTPRTTTSTTATSTSRRASVLELQHDQRARPRRRSGAYGFWVGSQFTSSRPAQPQFGREPAGLPGSRPGPRYPGARAPLRSAPVVGTRCNSPWYSAAGSRPPSSPSGRRAL